MSIYGDYAAQIIQGRRATELRAEARRDTVARKGNQDRGGRFNVRGSRSSKSGRARVA